MTQTQTRYVRTLKEFVRTRIPRWRGLLLKDRTSSLLPVWPRVLPFWPSDLLLYSNNHLWFVGFATSYSVWLGLFLVPTHPPTNSQSGASTGWMETRQCFSPSNHFHSIAYPHLLLLRNPVVFFGWNHWHSRQVAQGQKSRVELPLMLFEPGECPLSAVEMLLTKSGC